MIIEVLNKDFSIIKVDDLTDIDVTTPFCFVAKTDEELSVVIESERIPSVFIKKESGYVGMRITGELDFSLIGILSKITTILAENKIPVFAISTYNTDYVLIKKESLNLATKKLAENGYELKNI